MNRSLIPLVAHSSLSCRFVCAVRPCLVAPVARTACMWRVAPLVSHRSFAVTAAFERSANTSELLDFESARRDVNKWRKQLLYRSRQRGAMPQQRGNMWDNDLCRMQQPFNALAALRCSALPEAPPSFFGSLLCSAGGCVRVHVRARVRACRLAGARSDHGHVGR